MSQRVLIYILTLSICSVSSADCTEQDLSLLAARIKCGNSNTPANCSDILVTGSLAGIFMLGRLGKLNPKAEAYQRLFEEYRRVNAELVGSYKEVLRTYYELKKASANPVSEGIGEFNRDMYNEFKAQIDAKHPNNYFLQKFEGFYTENQVFQNALTQAMERTKSIFEKLNIKIDRTLIVDFATKAIGHSLYEGHKAYSDVSNEMGYKKNAYLPFKVNRKLLTYQETHLKLHQEANKIVEGLNKEPVTAPPKSPGGVVRGVEVIGPLALGTAALNVASNHHHVNACSKKWGIQLSESEILKLAGAVDLRQGIGEDCNKLGLQDSALNILSGPMSSSVKKFMCKMADKYNREQDSKLSDNVIQGIIDNPNCQKSWTVKTSAGDVKVEINTDGTWNYNSFHAQNSEFDNYLTDKLKSPMNDMRTRTSRLSPQSACDVEAKTLNAKAYCDLSRELFSYGVLSTAHKMMCASNTSVDSSQSSRGKN